MRNLMTKTFYTSTIKPVHTCVNGQIFVFPDKGKDKL